MRDDEFEDHLQQLRSALNDLISLLQEVGERHWAEVFTTAEQRLGQADSNALDSILSSSGGMGTFNDLVIHPTNGHSLAAERISVVNERRKELSNLVYVEAGHLKRALR